MSNRQFLFRLTIASAVAIPTVWLLISLWKANSKKSITSYSLETSTASVSAKPAVDVLKVTLLYATCTGTSRKFAKRLADKLGLLNVTVDIIDIKDFDEFQLEKGGIFLFLLSTYTDGKVPETAVRFFDWLVEQANDFRVERNYLGKVKFGVFGLGAKIYKKHFCTPAREINNALIDLGSRQLVPSLFGDDASNLEEKFISWTDLIIKALTVQKSNLVVNGNVETSDDALVSIPRPKKFFKESRAGGAQVRKPVLNVADKEVTASCQTTQSSETSSGCCQSTQAAGAKSESTGSCCNSNGNGGSGKREPLPAELEPPSDEEEEDRINNEFVTMDMGDSDSDGEGNGEDEDVDNNHPPADVGGCGSGDPEGTDLEDLGKAISTEPADTPVNVIPEGQRREMVTKLQRKALVKEGYRIIGSHSAVKLCRWTKNQMRGRGGCYKHSFYGITSYQCMEATPSLACANKCVFCWRHHKNPVGTEWRWKTDSPAMIVAEAVALHQGMINEMKGVPGVLPERLVEANTVKHCALSLVGEPIMYPRINDMLKELHDRKISSFLVTNAQFPDRMLELDPVTQLYVSVDAATKDSLKAIDRPLFKNYWDRFLGALQVLKDKKQRTVYRLTLVKDWNMEETEAYAELIEMGQPGEMRSGGGGDHFIEIKAMTYCGKSDASTLTMQNVPWHREVCAYSEAIAARLKERGLGPVYSIATEHEHSCCILLAREDKFLVDGVWHTWINYDKFNTLIQRYYESNRQITFTSQDYMEATPTWALYQNEAHGFDPVESRWKRNKAGSLVEVDYKSSSSGCG